MPSAHGWLMLGETDRVSAWSKPATFFGHFADDKGFQRAIYLAWVREAAGLTCTIAIRNVVQNGGC